MPIPDKTEDFLQRVLQSRLMLFESRLLVQQRLDGEFVSPFDPAPVHDADSADTSHLAPDRIPMSQVALALTLDPDLDLPYLPFTQTTIDEFASYVKGIGTMTLDNHSKEM